MPRDKPRLFIAQYVQNEAINHWALVVGPKQESRPDAKESRRFEVWHIFAPDNTATWQYMATDVPNLTARLLTRVMIAKVEDMNRLEGVLSKVSTKPADENWNCIYWVRDALAALQTDGKCLGTAVTDWEKVYAASTSYNDRKVQEGRFKEENYILQVPTWSLIDGVEIAK